MSVFHEYILDGKNTPGSSTRYLGLVLSPCTTLKRQVSTSEQVHGILLPASHYEDCSWLSVGLDWVLRFNKNNESRNFPSTKKEFEEGNTRYELAARGTTDTRDVPSWRLPRACAQFDDQGCTVGHLTPDFNPLMRELMLQCAGVMLNEIQNSGDSGLHLWRKA